MRAFQPMAQALSPNFSLAVTTISARVAISGSGPDLRVANDAAQGCFMRFTDVTGTAVTTDMWVAGGSIEIFNIPQGKDATDFPTHIAAITPTGTTTLRFTSGRGS